MAREEILAGPLTLWVAERGTAFPAPDADPGAGWTLIGKSGPENFTDDGVSLSLPQSIEEFIGAGSTMALKAFRTEESVEISVEVADMRIDTWRLVLNDNDETEDDGTREISLYRGGHVHHFALLARGTSPYEDDDDETADNVGQFQVPACYMSSEPEVTHQKGEVDALELTFRAVMPEGEELDDFVLIYSDADAEAPGNGNGNGNGD